MSTHVHTYIFILILALYVFLWLYHIYSHPYIYPLSIYPSIYLSSCVYTHLHVIWNTQFVTLGFFSCAGDKAQILTHARPCLIMF
jgi:hypothetical protein